MKDVSMARNGEPKPTVRDRDLDVPSPAEMAAVCGEAFEAVASLALAKGAEPRQVGRNKARFAQGLASLEAAWRDRVVEPHRRQAANQRRQQRTLLGYYHRLLDHLDERGLKPPPELAAAVLSRNAPGSPGLAEPYAEPGLEWARATPRPGRQKTALTPPPPAAAVAPPALAVAAKSKPAAKGTATKASAWNGKAKASKAPPQAQAAATGKKAKGRAAATR